jgi:hypothetical protein
MDFVLSRGCFYPKDHRQAELLVELHGEIEVGYCRLEQARIVTPPTTNEQSVPPLFHPRCAVR